MDIYVLAPVRSAAAVEQFLACFLTDREPAQADYSVRHGGNEPAMVFDTLEELATFCEANQEAEAQSYWLNVAANDPQSAHVFFLPDGGLVLGLSVASQCEADWGRWLGHLRSFTGAEFGYWTGECPPKETVAEFVAVAQSHAEL